MIIVLRTAAPGGAAFSYERKTSGHGFSNSRSRDGHQGNRENKNAAVHL